MVRGASCTRRFDIDKITQIGWFVFLEEIVSNRNDFMLYELLELEPTKPWHACVSEENV